ncbi:hypothetical protein [Kutzneria sp. 744]|jgi:hypothetical protein|uniref:hypothetical protein n=1 Tax=Kutzneria sp. (strain 744) TaxID=345341 RepID=UPI0003EEC9BE|nr:hypothetical protein [Kutzneria sp. 744]EWM17115.1 hypothetical protein KUTG_07419 [Kutzneria sp. 744]
MTMELKPGLSAWWLRAAIAVVGLAVLGVLELHGLGFPLMIVFLVVIAVTVAIPSSPGMTVLIGGAAVATAFTDGNTVSVAALLLIPLLHMGHVLAGIAGVLPIGARLHLSAFRRPLRRYLLIQVAVLTLAAVALVLPAGRIDPIVEVAGLLAAAGIALVALPRR